LVVADTLHIVIITSLEGEQFLIFPRTFLHSTVDSPVETNQLNIIKKALTGYIEIFQLQKIYYCSYSSGTVVYKGRAFLSNDGYQGEGFFHWAINFRDGKRKLCYPSICQCGV